MRCPSNQELEMTPHCGRASDEGDLLLPVLRGRDLKMAVGRKYFDYFI
jgi:hypothetical protein